MLFRDVELQEPAFKEVLVAYRQAPSPPGATILKEQLRKGIAGLNPMSWWGGAKAKETVQIQERLPVQIRIYRDIPVSALDTLQRGDSPKQRGVVSDPALSAAQIYYFILTRCEPIVKFRCSR